MSKYVYSFNEGSKEMKSLLGGKGANLAEMTKIGLPVPYGFTVTTEACNKYYEDAKELSDEVIHEIFDHLSELEKEKIVLTKPRGNMKLCKIDHHDHVVDILVYLFNAEKQLNK